MPISSFIPAGDRPANSQLDSEGRFELTTFGDEGDPDGCVVGTHKVAITAYEMLGKSTRRWLVPKECRNYQTSGLAIAIDEATDSLEVNVSWDGEKPLVERIHGGEEYDPAVLD